MHEYYAPVVQDPLLSEYDMKFYFLDIAAENNSIFISGYVTLNAEVVSPALDTFAFELLDQMVIDSVYVNGISRPFTHENDMGFVQLSAPVNQGTDLTVKIKYSGTPPTGGFFSGISTGYSSQWGKNVTWTLSEPYAARDWWPTKQDLTDKADSAWIFVTTSATNKVGSEGLLTGITNMPNGKVRYEWKTKYPIDYYLISISVAEYQDYSFYAHPDGASDSLLIQNYIYDSPGCLNYYKLDIDNTDDFIELYSDLFGLYPFIDEKYGHCLAEMGGAMEHQTMTTMGGFGFGIIAHELGHMWFGDNVTCATWSDIWINEGFATYTDYLAHHYLATPYYDSLWLKIRHDQVKQEPGGSVYVPPDQLNDIWRIFDSRLSYSKGSLLLHMIRYELQDDSVFYDVLQTWGEDYGDSVGTGMDYKAILENISGMDFTDFFNQWYFGEGYPIYNIVWNQGNGMLNINSTQTASTIVTTLFKMNVPYLVKFDDGTDTTLNLFQSDNFNSYSIPVSKTVTELDVDPKQWILHKLNSISVGIEETENPVHFAIGPNPAHDVVNVYFSKRAPSDYKITISDITGRVVLESTRRTINISALSPGAYLVRVTDGNESMTKRIIKSY